MRTLSQFQQKPPISPGSDAETLMASDFTRETRRPSKFAPGSDVFDATQTCPSCAADMPIEHGDTAQCDCGLYAVLYGNCLTVWR